MPTGTIRPRRRAIASGAPSPIRRRRCATLPRAADGSRRHAAKLRPHAACRAPTRAHAPRRSLCRATRQRRAARRAALHARQLDPARSGRAQRRLDVPARRVAEHEHRPRSTQGPNQHCDAIRPATWRTASSCRPCITWRGGATCPASSPSSASPAATGATTTSAASYEKTPGEGRAAPTSPSPGPSSPATSSSPRGRSTTRRRYAEAQGAARGARPHPRHPRQPALLPGRRPRVLRDDHRPARPGGPDLPRAAGDAPGAGWSSRSRSATTWPAPGR